jgi:hypothetical protein
MKALRINEVGTLKVKPLLIRANRALAWGVVAMPLLGWALHWPWWESTLWAIALGTLHGVASLAVLPMPARVRTHAWNWSFLAVGTADGSYRLAPWSQRELFWWRALRTGLAYVWPWVAVGVMVSAAQSHGFVSALLVLLGVLAFVVMNGWLAAAPFLVGFHLSGAVQAALMRWHWARGLGPTARVVGARLLVFAYFAAIVLHMFQAAPAHLKN